MRRCTHTSGSSSTGGSASTGGFLSWEQHTKLGIDISIRKVETQGAVQNAECSGRTVGFFFAEGLGLPTGFLPCFLASALAALVRAFAIEVVEVFSFPSFPAAYPQPTLSLSVIPN